MLTSHDAFLQKQIGTVRLSFEGKHQILTSQVPIAPLSPRPVLSFSSPSQNKIPAIRQFSLVASLGVCLRSYLPAATPLPSPGLAHTLTVVQNVPLLHSTATTVVLMLSSPVPSIPAAVTSLSLSLQAHISSHKGPFMV